MYMTLVTAVLIFDVRNKLNLGVMVVKPPWGDTIYELFIKYSFKYLFYTAVCVLIFYFEA